MSKEKNQGNPEIGMATESFEQAEAKSSSGSKDFFNELDAQVNGAIIDEPSTEATLDNFSGSEQVTHNTENQGSQSVNAQSEDSTDWKKRYEDSSREAVKLKEQMNDLKPFVPVLNAMKKDSGLVNHVRDYLVNGGTPSKTIQEQLNLPEDFVFDQQEAMSNPDSDSAKVMSAHVDSIVQQRVSQIMGAEKKRAQQNQIANARKAEEQAFKEKHNLSDEDFNNFVNEAKQRKLKMEDVYYILNKDKAAQNVAQSTKQDMLSQMKNVRNMPTSASGANNQDNGSGSPDRDLFDGLLSLDDGVDNMFG